MSQFLTPAMAWLFAFSVVGLLAHFLSARLRGQLADTLVEYLFIKHRGYMLSTLIALIAADLALVAVGQIEGIATHILGALGFTTGYSLDSCISPSREDYHE